MSDAHVLTPEDLRRLDAEYRPIEPFDAWADLAPPSEVWDRYVERYDAARADASPEALAAALADVTRGAAFDTGAIEGLYAGDRGITHTVMTQAATWEAYVAQERGPKVVDFVKAHVEAFEMALDLATGQRPVTESWIRQVHEVVCAPQDTYEVTTPIGRQSQPLRKGVYKDLPNHVRQPDGTRFAYAPVDAVGPEVGHLVGELRRPDLLAAHPVTQAAYAHHAFVRIHPFADGNGRVARVLASVPVLRTLSVPLVIFADQRVPYIDVLESADAGRRDRLVGFVADRVIDTLAIVTNGLRTDAPTDAVRSLRDLDERVRARTEGALTPLWERIRTVLADEWSQQVDGLGVPNLRAAATRSPHETISDSRGSLGEGYRPMRGKQLALEASLDGRSFGRRRVWMVAGIAVSPYEDYVLRIVAEDNQHRPVIEPVDVRTDEIDPELTVAFRLKLAAWVRRLAGDEVRRLAGRT